MKIIFVILLLQQITQNLGYNSISRNKRFVENVTELQQNNALRRCLHYEQNSTYQHGNQIIHLLRSKNKGKSIKYDDSHLPSDFRGYGPGENGEVPPEGAYLSPQQGRPDLCYLPIDHGSCNQRSSMYGFYPEHDDCRMFDYKGCSKNLNSFVTYRHCIATCKPPVKSNCLGFDTKFKEE